MQKLNSYWRFFHHLCDFHVLASIAKRGGVGSFVTALSDEDIVKIIDAIDVAMKAVANA